VPFGKPFGVSFGVPFGKPFGGRLLPQFSFKNSSRRRCLTHCARLRQAQPERLGASGVAREIADA
jgi:hypothetical protein